jgi:hypothetical protein
LYLGLKKFVHYKTNSLKESLSCILNNHLDQYKNEIRPAYVSYVKHADEIIVQYHGEILERGSHQLVACMQRSGIRGSLETPNYLRANTLTFH